MPMGNCSITHGGRMFYVSMPTELDCPASGSI